MDGRIEAAVRELVDALRSEVAPPAADPPRLLSISEAGRVLGVGRSSLYNEIGAGRLQTVKVGRRRLVPSTAVAQYAGQSPPGPGK